MNKRRALYCFLSILALFLVGTVVVLSSVTYYLAIDPDAYLSEDEVPILDNTTRWDPAEHNQIQHIPKIIHQTWKTETLPLRWQNISQGCRDVMPDYEYKLWTDASSREFIKTHYPWFLETFDGYKYNIQRADVIRYFVLYHYGGVYIDLDIGCNRPLDPLLAYPVILAKTIPVGVSNDLLFAAPKHSFYEQTIHNLGTFAHDWVLNYPTVMFSTGPMFISAQYGIYTSAHPTTSTSEIRVLPKSLYGKNAKKGEAPNAFFSHYYGSSWHADDAAFIGFLGTWGKGLMWLGLVILIFGLFKLSKGQRRYGLRRYDILLPRLSQRSGRWQLVLGGSSAPSTQPSSPGSNSAVGSPVMDHVPVLQLPLDVRSPSPSPTPSPLFDSYAGRMTNPIVEVYRRIRNSFSSAANSPRDDVFRTSIRSRRRRPRNGVLFFLPAILSSDHDIELENTRDASSSSPRRPTTLPPEKQQLIHDLERGDGGDDDDDRSDSGLIDFSRRSHRSRSRSASRVRSINRS